MQDRDYKGRFSILKCTNTHDRCFGGAGGPCPYCEPMNKGIQRERDQLQAPR
jgi:hypothetical protein